MSGGVHPGRLQLPGHSPAAPLVSIRAESVENVRLRLAAVYSSRRFDISGKSRRPITNPRGKPLVAYTEGVTVTGNCCLYLTGVLVQESDDFRTMRCSNRS
jgi:hypothetical protein